MYNKVVFRYLLHCGKSILVVRLMLSNGADINAKREMFGSDLRMGAGCSITENGRRLMQDQSQGENISQDGYYRLQSAHWRR